MRWLSSIVLKDLSVFVIALKTMIEAALVKIVTEGLSEIKEMNSTRFRRRRNKGGFSAF